MMNTIWAVIRDGRIEPSEPISLPEGSRVLVTLVASDEETRFWQGVGEHSLQGIWSDPADDVYGKLL